MKRNLELFYTQPATRWEETLPIGNGSLGAMIWGNVGIEKLGLNEESLWSGYEREKNNHSAFDYLEKVRELIFKGKCHEAEVIIRENMLGEYNEGYLPLGNLNIIYKNIMSDCTPDLYRRSLDIENSIAMVDFSVKEVNYHRELFASYPAQAVIVKLTADKPVMELELYLESELKCNYFNEGNSLCFKGKCPEHLDPSYVRKGEEAVIWGYRGKRFSGAIRVLECDGAVEFKNDKINVSKASFLIFAIEAVKKADLKRYEVLTQNNAKYLKRYEVLIQNNALLNDKFTTNEVPLKDDNVIRNDVSLRSDDILTNDDSEKDENTLGALNNNDIYTIYNFLKEEHIKDYQNIYNEVELYLGEQKDIPTDVRLEALKKGESDNGLFGLYFQYGRYLMISSSREGSLPANLQGIWNWQFQAPWSCNWTTNINLEMNYWPALSCGLEKCMEPYFAFVEKLAENGKNTARINYHCRGTTHHHNADAWYSTNPVGIGYGCEAGQEKSVSWSMWPMGMAWLSQEFYRYYEYSNDTEFLKNRAYPLLKETALFLVDWLVEFEGKYVTCPSTSPENKFYTEDGDICSITMASAMDLELIEEVFEHYILAYEELKEEALKIDESEENKNTNMMKANLSDKSLKAEDEELYNEIKNKLEKLHPVQIGSYGQILEWFKEYKEVEPGHRHISHLYGMFPGELWEGNDKLTKACRISLDNRMKNGGGYTGWSCAWIINMFAVLGDGEEAGKYLNMLLTRSTYPNLWDAHEPFQIDGNFGGIAGMANMLVQDRGGEVKLLPALPKQFASGYAKGIRIKNKKAVDIEWKDGKVTSWNIYSI